MDKDNSGDFDKDELLEYAHLLGIQVTPEQADELLQACDADGNGTVSFDEIVKAFGLE
jgi:Ca2+-binding EF-hand superfamily protein